MMRWYIPHRPFTSASVIRLEKASQEEQNGAHFSSVAPPSEELGEGGGGRGRGEGGGGVLRGFWLL